MHQTEYVSTEALAEITATSRGFWNKLRATDDGPPFTKIGRAVRYHLPTAKNWLAERTRGTRRMGVEPSQGGRV